jgi:probable DNA metabolism protein
MSKTGSVTLVALPSETDLDAWRTAARRLRLAGVPPEAVCWSTESDDLFAEANPVPSADPTATPAPFTAPAAFLDLARKVICHRSPDRFGRLYRLLWRLRDQPRLLDDRTDPDVADALAMAKAVSRASHKMKAFVRFRRLEGAEPETFVAWFEPPHRVVERTAPFFAARFANGRFSILTPDRCAHWNGAELSFTPGASKADAPSEDELEAYWLTYYASIFNPARLKVAAMTSEMPKRYWRNLPEAALIPALIEDARARTETMVASEPTQPQRRLAPRPPPPDTPVDAATLETCRRCDLWRDATQGVPGEGPLTAELMIVGEQPGDTEDLAGKPFVGPAGALLDRAMMEAGLDRGRAWVTNAVKHFKHEPRGKRRLHRTPDAGEISACRWWLDQERALIRPRTILALGGSAALAVFGKAMPILKSRGTVFALEDGAKAMITVHPSYLLRLPDQTEKAEAYAAFVRDLSAVRALMEHSRAATDRP